MFGFGVPRWTLFAAALLVSVASRVSAPSGAGAPDNAERQKLCGLWKGYTVEGKGENPDTGPVKIELTITEKTIHGIQIQGDKRVDQGVGEYMLNPGASPHGLDASKTNERGRKESYIGIYSIEGDTLKWCVGRKDRPTSFESTKGQFLLILKRDKAK